MTPHIIPSVPPLQPIPRLSPSRASQFRSCQLRAVWEAGETPPLLPLSLYARVGTVTHKLLELAYGERLEASASNEWDKQIALQEDEMRNHWIEAHLIPIANHMAALESYRQRCLHLLAFRNFDRKKVQSHSPSGDRSGVEISVADHSKQVKGRIDLVRRTEQGYEIVDYKTGRVFDDGQCIKDEYQQQLRIYAALFHDTFGVWPSKLTIIGLDGVECDIPFLQNESERLLRESIELLLHLNARVRDGVSAVNLATPSPTACGHCRYRPACSRYWETRPNQRDWPQDVQGTVKRQVRQGDGNIRIVLDTKQGQVSVSGLAPMRHGLPTEIGLDRQCSIYNVIPEKETKASFYEGPLTTLYWAHENNH